MSLKNNKHFAQFIQLVSDVKIQGATAVAEATLEALGHYLTSINCPRSGADWYAIKKIANQLSQVRPTEPMAHNLTNWLINELRYNFRKTTQSAIWFTVVNKTVSELKYKCREINAKISENGSLLVKNEQIIFTHCHSSLVESILVRARRQKKKFEVYHTETRPLYQGRITANHLRLAGIKSTMVTDSAAAWLISNRSGDEVDVDWILLGADSLAKDGSVTNKIGSFAIALAAHDSGLPVYVASNLLKFDHSGSSHIELRSTSEIWPGAPRGTRIINYAFDKVPAKYITGIISEFGIIKPAHAFRLAKVRYPYVYDK